MFVVQSCAACISSSAVRSGSSCCRAWARTASHGASCRSLGRSGIVSRTARAPVDVALAAQLSGLPDRGVGVGLPLGPARLRRVRRPGRDVDRVLLPAAGGAGVDQAARGAGVDHQVAAVDSAALGDVDVAGVGQLGRLLQVRGGDEERAGPLPRPGLPGHDGHPLLAAAGQALDPDRVPVRQRLPVRVDPGVQPGPDQVTAPGPVAVRQRDLSLADQAEFRQPLAGQGRPAGPPSRSTWPSAGIPVRTGAR